MDKIIMKICYESEFNQAINRSIKNNIDNPGFCATKKRFLDESFLNRLPVAVRDVLGEFKAKDLSMNCFEANLKILPIVNSMIDGEACLTFGYINTSQQSFFKSDVNEFISLINNEKIIDKQLTLHCWITLPSYEIIDSTFSTSYAIAFDYPNLMYRVTSLHPSELKNGMSYHPQFVGNDFLFKTGILHLRIENYL